jgi:predicted transcriptional regulator
MGSRRAEQEDQKTAPAALPSSSERQQMFADVVSNYVDNNFAAVRFYNDMMSVNEEALKNSWSQAKNNLKVFSKITLDSAKMFEHIFGDYAKMSMNHTGTNIRIG